MGKKVGDKETNLITYQLTQSCDAKFLIVAAEGGDVSIWRWTENRYVRLCYTDKLR